MILVSKSPIIWMIFSMGLASSAWAKPARATTYAAAFIVTINGIEMVNGQRGGNNTLEINYTSQTRTWMTMEYTSKS
jgi:hypothetical protein